MGGHVPAIGVWIPVVLCAAAIFWASALPHPERILPILAWPGIDKVCHGLAYGIFAVLSFRAFGSAAGAWGARHALPLALLLAGLYGLSDEWHQSFVPFRTSDSQDWLADAAGACSAVLGWRHFLR